MRNRARVRPSVVAVLMLGALVPNPAGASTQVFQNHAQFAAAAGGSLVVEALESGVVADGGAVDCGYFVDASNPCFSALDPLVGFAAFDANFNQSSVILYGRHVMANTSKVVGLGQPDAFLGTGILANGGARAFGVSLAGPGVPCDVFILLTNDEVFAESTTCAEGGFVGAVSDAGVASIFVTASSIVGIDAVHYLMNVPTVLTAYPAVVSTSGPQQLPLTLSATLTAGGAPLAGQAVSFSIEGVHQCTATTDANGYAACGGTPSAVDVLLAGEYTAIFPGSGIYSSSSSTGGIIG